MNIEELLDSRRQVKRFDHINIPDKSLIKSLLDTTWRLVPSKQNLMPYKVHILGPEHKKEKEIIFDQSTKVEELIQGIKDKPKEVKYNSNACFHILAPYLLIFTPRLSKGSPAVQQRIKDGHEYTVCDPKRYREEVQITSIEIGMFASTLSALALEKEIDVSYNKNFCHWPKFKEYWKELPFVDEPPYLLMSLGYRRYKNKVISRPLIEDEYKENIDDIINWV